MPATLHFVYPQYNAVQVQACVAGPDTVQLDSMRVYVEPQGDTLRVLFSRPARGMAGQPDTATVALPDDRPTNVYVTTTNIHGVESCLSNAVQLGSAASVPFAARTRRLSVTPNPSTGELRVDFNVQDAARYTITVHDVQGREVLRVLDAELTPGRHTLFTRAHQLPPGVFTFRLAMTGHNLEHQMVVVVW